MIINTRIKCIEDFDDSWFTGAFNSLPSWRKERASRMKNPESRKLSILAGSMFMDAILENDCDPEKVIFNEYGKPMMDGDVPVYFSISHSGGAVAVSVSTPNDMSPVLPGDNRIDATSVFAAAGVAPRSFLKSSQGLSIPSIGVDIEKLRSYDERIAERFFSKEEQEYLKHTDEKDENFTRIWTSKEAYGKFTGKGITDGLKFSMFHDPLVPLNVLLPCCFEHYETEINGERYMYALCYGVLDLNPAVETEETEDPVNDPYTP